VCQLKPRPFYFLLAPHIPVLEKIGKTHGFRKIYYPQLQVLFQSDMQFSCAALIVLAAVATASAVESGSGEADEPGTGKGSRVLVSDSPHPLFLFPD
jgi:hypothetical protein